MTVSSSPRIAFVQASWHEEVVDHCRAAFAEEVEALGLPPSRIDYFTVAGSFELPLYAKRLAQSGRYAAVVAAGLVVDGGIYRHEFVAEAVIDGLMRVQLDTEVPIISVVLTPHHFHEHDQHLSFFSAHMAVKGKEAARACLTTMNSLTALEELATA